ncbi:beta-N-acetylhexosaminidase [Fervidobacterium thailandense]|uniref:beta-N-acetylhexosaminidase n=1 Tax=Fervidobacterium thailandense TaxID=1008305 RepID=A0A1E3G4L8_9BACT|nr:family 20 glycosylhydrolase [Fervidobacterium thailandense]ODN31070.1 glycoside hydrolase [Fervidobacterium thailandense]
MDSVDNILLIPKPKAVELLNGKLRIGKNSEFATLFLDVDKEILSDTYLDQMNETFLKIGWRVRRGRGNGTSGLNVKIRLDPFEVNEPQGYRLTIQDDVEILARDREGAHYGLQTLKQILRQAGKDIPRLRINDFPDFPNRGVMLDISRDRIPKTDVLKELVEKLSELKINQLQLYTEHTFAYKNHRKVWEGFSPLTHEEIEELDKFCKSHFVELVPNQNTFGHMSKWLIHEEYRHLAETPEGFVAPWGQRYEFPFSLSPAVPESLKLIEDILGELLPLFSSSKVNIGCDETFDLCLGKSKELCKERGKGRVYLDFLLKIYTIAKRYKEKVMFWGDIIENHPELISELPRDLVPMIWGYEAGHPFQEKCKLFSSTGLEFYVCPGTSTWNSFVGRSENALKNIVNAVENGKKFGAIGVLVTDWGDNGHPQHLAFSYLGFAWSAWLSWNSITPDIREFLQTLNVHVYETGEDIATLVYEYGKLCERIFYTPNGTPYFYALVYPDRMSSQIERYNLDELRELRNHIEELDRKTASLKNCDIREQLLNGSEFVKLGLNVLEFLKLYADVQNVPDEIWERFAQALETFLMVDYRRIWMKYNRPGGFDQSVHKLSRILRVRNGDSSGLIF